MPTVPLFGLGVGTKSPNVSVQARINIYAEKLAEPDKSAVVFYARPGFQRVNFTLVGPPLFTGPNRGAIGVQSNNGLAVTPSDYLFTFTGVCVNVYANPNPGVFTSAAGGSTDPIAGIGPVRSAFDGNSIVAVNGVDGFIVSVPNGLTFKIPDAAFPRGAQTVTFLGGRFFCDDPSNPGRFRWSDLYNGQSWPSLNFATAESNPDPLVGVFEAHGQLLLFGTRTLEFWALQPTGYQSQQPVAAVPGSTLMWGCEAYDTIRKVGDRVVFVGRNNNGDRKVLMLDGYRATVISTPDVEASMQEQTGAPDITTALVMGKAGHTFYVLSLLTQSWVYDLETGNWDIWQTQGGQFGARWAAAAFGELLLADYRDNKVHTVNTSILLDDGQTIVREMTSRHLFGPDLERLSVGELVIDMQTGVGNAVAPGDNPMVTLTWSKDGGHTYGNDIAQPMGRLGEYRTRAVWRFLGISPDWTFRLRVTDPVTTAIIGANMKVGA